jgi:hypothetical protein
MTATEDQKRDILAAVKAKAYEVSRLLNEEEFKEIAESIIK